MTQFVSSVLFAGNNYFGEAATTKKDAEQKAARVAVKSILATNNNCMKEIYSIQDVVLSKSILNEFAVKTKATPPTYDVNRREVLGFMTQFVSSVVFAGNNYFGEAATTKKDAEQKAARVAVKSILATNNNCMKEIIRSKKQLSIAITSAGFNKERAVSQENGNAPTNAITTYQGAASPTAYQGANIIPAADPSAQAMSVSKKRKRRRTTG